MFPMPLALTEMGITIFLELYTVRILRNLEWRYLIVGDKKFLNQMILKWAGMELSRKIG
jgi:hypothetical protein